jgi:hypothetical protein
LKILGGEKGVLKRATQLLLEKEKVEGKELKTLTEPVMRLDLEANDPSAWEEKKKEVLEIISESDPTMTIDS